MTFNSGQFGLSSHNKNKKILYKYWFALNLKKEVLLIFSNISAIILNERSKTFKKLKMVKISSLKQA